MKSVSPILCTIMLLICNLTHAQTCLDNPLDWPWLKIIIDDDRPCSHFEVVEFEYEDQPHVYINLLQGFFPNNGPACAFESLTTYYNCNGDIICQTGFLPQELICTNEKLLESGENGSLIYTTRAQNKCEDPLSIDIVEELIRIECLQTIYKVEYEGQTYLYLDQTCEAIDRSDVIITCTTGDQCLIGARARDEECEALLDQLRNLINNESIIWQKECECPENYDPVCGADGMTYSNECFAKCAGTFSVGPGECGTQSEIFNMYPWLHELISPEACADGTMVRVYETGPYAFILVTYADGNGALYFQDGTFYCNEIVDTRSCAALYELGEPVSTWTCDDSDNPNASIEIVVQNLICNDNGTFTIDVTATGSLSMSYGIYGPAGEPQFGIFNKGETYTYTGNTLYAEDGLYSFFVYDSFLADVGATEYVIDISECETPNNPALFENYPWLADLVDITNCQDVVIHEYYNGSYAYITITTANGLQLYYQTGDLFCADAPNYSCVEMYRLTGITDTWTCGNIHDDNEITPREHTLKVSAYPNPTDGRIYLNVSGEENIPSRIEVFDIQGRMVHSASSIYLANQIITLDLPQELVGTYYIKISTSDDLKVIPIAVY